MNLREFLDTNGVQYDSSTFYSYSFYRNSPFKEIKEELVEYDEGGIRTEYTFQFGDKFYRISVYSNSWSEYDDDFSDIEVEEVVPQEQTIIVYVKKE